MTLQLRSRLKNRYLEPQWEGYLNTGIKRTYFKWDPSIKDYIAVPLTKELTTTDTTIAMIDGDSGNRVYVFDIRHRSEEHVLGITGGVGIRTEVTWDGVGINPSRFEHLFNEDMKGGCYIPAGFYLWIQQSADRLRPQES